MSKHGPYSISKFDAHSSKTFQTASHLSNENEWWNLIFFCRCTNSVEFASCQCKIRMKLRDRRRKKKTRISLLLSILLSFFAPSSIRRALFTIMFTISRLLINHLVNFVAPLNLISSRILAHKKSLVLLLYTINGLWNPSLSQFKVLMSLNHSLQLWTVVISCYCIGSTTIFPWPRSQCMLPGMTPCN